MTGIVGRVRALLPIQGWFFRRPVVLFHSDDWGLAGIRDRAGAEELRSAGLGLGSPPYDAYSLETAEDLDLLFKALGRHRDSIGRPPCITANFVTANVDFGATAGGGFERIELMPLARGLPDPWSRPGLLEAYRRGVEAGFLRPALHGVTHFCLAAAGKRVADPGPAGERLRRAYRAGTPQIYGGEPWMGYEFHDGTGWLPAQEQRRIIEHGARLFEELFGRRPFSACAPGYRANADTRAAWSGAGIRVAQCGPSMDLAPHGDEHGLLLLYRNVPFEPCARPEREERELLELALAAASSGRPIVVCMHSVNLHSTIRNHRDAALDRLESFLTALEAQFPALLYLNDDDLASSIASGCYEWRGRRVPLPSQRRLQASAALRYHLGRV